MNSDELVRFKDHGWMCRQPLVIDRREPSRFGGCEHLTVAGKTCGQEMGVRRCLYQGAEVWLCGLHQRSPVYGRLSDAAKERNRERRHAWMVAQSQRDEELDIPAIIAERRAESERARAIVDELLPKQGANMNDLNEAMIGGDYRPLSDVGIESGTVRCVFRNHTESLLGLMDEYGAMIGCVAWLTNERILHAMTKIRTAIVVQKEDFLRPDFGDRSAANLRPLYDALGGIHLNTLPNPLPNMCYLWENRDRIFRGVRCMGIRRPERQEPSILMHHKFAVFGDRETSTWEHPLTGIKRQHREFKWKTVWTGSFNFTEGSARSLENSLIIRDPKIAEAYALEFGQVAALSEPLDWTKEWVSPEWRIGT